MGTKKRYLFWMHKSKARISIILSPDTACCREKQLKQKIPKGFSIFPSKVMLGGSESVEKNHPSTELGGSYGNFEVSTL